MGDQEENENSANQQVNNNQHARNNNAIPVVGEGLHAAHQAILQQGGPVGFQPYRRPLNFPLRVGTIRLEQESSSFKFLLRNLVLSLVLLVCSPLYRHILVS